MVDHYTQAGKILAAADTEAGHILADVLGTRFSACNNLVGFQSFFKNGL